MPPRKNEYLSYRSDKWLKHICIGLLAIKHVILPKLDKSSALVYLVAYSADKNVDEARRRANSLPHDVIITSALVKA